MLGHRERGLGRRERRPRRRDVLLARTQFDEPQRLLGRLQPGARAIQRELCVVERLLRDEVLRDQLLLAPVMGLRVRDIDTRGLRVRMKIFDQVSSGALNSSGSTRFAKLRSVFGALSSAVAAERSVASSGCGLRSGPTYNGSSSAVSRAPTPGIRSQMASSNSSSGSGAVSAEARPALSGCAAESGCSSSSLASKSSASSDSPA